MDIIIWIAVGAMLGAGGYSYLGFNASRGIVVSAIIGALGALLGGKMLAPLFSTSGAVPVPGEFNTMALFFAAFAAAVVLALGDQVYKRWGV